MVNHVNIISEMTGPDVARDALHAVLVEVLGGLDGSWKAEVRCLEPLLCWEVLVQGERRTVRVLLGSEPDEPEVLRARLKAALAGCVLVGVPGARPTRKGAARMSLLSESNGRLGVY